MAQRKVIKLDNAQVLAALEGPDGRNLSVLAARCGVQAHVRGLRLAVEAPDRESFTQFMAGFNQLRQASRRGNDPERARRAAMGQESPKKTPSLSISVQPKTEGQQQYWKILQKHDIVFGVGQPGTGKTYLAVAAACQALTSGSVQKIIISRPVVEAGESLGFLPGGLEEKIDPYLRPIFDALELLLGRDAAQRLRKDGLLEIAPIAYLRGRTFAKCFVLLDEAQNCTPSQIKMFLSRLGEGSRMVVTGDRRQSDIRGPNGLVYAMEALQGVDVVQIVELTGRDIVRHELVGVMMDAFDKFDRG